MKVIYNTIEVRRNILYNNEKDTPMYGGIPEDFDNVKKLMGEFLSLLTVNRQCDIIGKQSGEISFKSSIRSAYEHTGKYLWDEDKTTAEMIIDENDITVDTDKDKSQDNTDHNNTYMDI